MFSALAANRQTVAPGGEGVTHADQLVLQRDRGESTGFNDAMAERAINDTGLLSNFMLANHATMLGGVHAASQAALSAIALDNHVNNYDAVKASTPYISLGAGAVEYQGRGKPTLVLPALGTALRFATRRGKSAGFIFRLWVVTTPRPAADIPGLAEDVRDLKLFAGFHKFHYQGEVTAKLYVPRRQVAWVMKVDKLGDPLDASWSGGESVLKNPDFVEPYAVSNVIGAL